MNGSLTAVVITKHSPSVPTLPGIVSVLILAGLTLGLASCATWSRWFSEDGYLIPDDEGLYAVRGDKLQRLDGNPNWEAESWPKRSDFAPGARFVIYESALRQSQQPPTDMIRLSKVAWVRSKFSANGAISPVTDSRWAAPDLKKYEIPLKFRTVDSRKDLLLATPARPLEPGLYALEFRTTAKQIGARVGIQWSTVNQERYSASACVDRYADGSYRPCDDQPQVLSTSGLSLYLVNPESKTAEGSRMVVVRGVVINTSDRPRHVPELEGVLRTADGQVVKQWRFTPETTELPPGESSEFRSEVQDPPPQAHDVYVRFAAASADSGASIETAK